MSTKMNEDEIFQQAKAEGEKWIAALNFSSDGDVDAVQKCLDARVFEGNPVKAYVVRSPKEASDLLLRLVEEAPAEKQKEYMNVVKDAHNCIWDYYLMAFYESACSVLPNKDFPHAEFIYQSLFPAFQNGLKYFINLGPVIVGVMGPRVKFDEAGRIHCQDGPAEVWGEEKFYFWRGVQVPAEWIEDKDNQDPMLGLRHPNIEERRAFCEIVGWSKIIGQLKPKVIDTDADPEIGELMEVNLPDSGKEKFLKVMCGTKREFVIPVPSNMNTALEANAWTWGLDGSEYSPEVRT